MNNEKEKVEFGNYLLSKQREELTSELNQDKVTHGDIENFKYLKEKGLLES